jgi:hypothetical protein
MDGASVILSANLMTDTCRAMVKIVDQLISASLISKAGAF